MTCYLANTCELFCHPQACSVVARCRANELSTEAYELGVDNPRVTQVVRVGCPRNLGVLLQEFGRAGRKEGMVANALLYFNEYIDDKRLGL